MNLVQIKYFHKTIKCGGVSAAAEKLFITQPAVSKQIKLIEEEIGNKLFYKRKNSLQLTATGKLLFEKSCQILSLLDELNNDLKNVKGNYSGKVILGCGSLAARFTFPKIIKNYLRKYPETDISIFECGSDEMETLLTNDIIDIGTGFKTITKNKNIEFENFFSSRLKVICSKKSRLAGLKIIKFDDILEFPCISYTTNSVVNKILEKYLPSDTTNIIINAQNSETIIKYVQMDFGISIVPDYILKLLNPTAIVTKELDVKLFIDFGVFKDKNKYFSPAHKEFLELLRTHYKKY
ncbi:MAG: LysR family transcriptional regulator [Desulfobacula sp.]|uniref:LysR family transcriptional regulator n=1 Tax=Desulfobacula sp. TaxID=2593537 RepID=UPI0025C04695|nr:LysR family transcriptional regulator [Desulfobacula sp.]MCD4720436.1 LysR family transcriptional regulator [Desulfobacula sp.]